MTKNLIILTAAVKPNPLYGAALSDPAERLRQYVASISEWARIADSASFDLLVVETSGEAEALSRYFPTHAFAATEETALRGKGAVEAAALDDALALAGLSERSTVVKVTGRLRVKNAKRLVSPSNEVVVRRTLNRAYCDTRFFISPYGAWLESLRRMHLEVDESRGRYLEHVMAYRLITAEYAGEAIGRFPERPMILGSSGTTSQKYGSRAQQVMTPLLSAFEKFAGQKVGVKQI